MKPVRLPRLYCALRGLLPLLPEDRVRERTRDGGARKSKVGGAVRPVECRKSNVESPEGQGARDGAARMSNDQ